MKTIISFGVLAILVSGCANNAIKVTGQPKESITLEDAFRSVGKSLRALDEEKGDRMLGIVASSIEVTFNISSAATDNQGVNILTPPLINSVGSGVPSSSGYTNSDPRMTTSNSSTLGGNSISAQSTVTGVRANQVTVKFESVLKLMKGLKMEKIKLLKELGYFNQKGFMPTSYTSTLDGKTTLIDLTTIKKTE